MNFQFFDSLNAAEATEFLNTFLDTERKAVEEIISAARSEGVYADLSVASVPEVLKCVVGKLTTVPRLPDETVPSWIRETDSYSRGLFDFDETSTVVILRAAYYLGQSLVNHSERLSWSVGNIETAEKNMPVITGFTFELELAPIMVVENLFRRIIADGAAYDAIDQAMNYWLDKVHERIQ
ncbi:MAG TPA: hypothetical protein VFH31_00105 [Pyrinomonadaceae bacterium]|nr:hypothetical protein [Pyrinomonadaceae bacterium]